MITFNCPHCNHTLNIPDQYAGQNGTCNHCNAQVKAPLSPFEGGPGDVPPPFSTPSSPMGAVDLNNLDINPDNYVRGLAPIEDDATPHRVSAARSGNFAEWALKMQAAGLSMTCGGCLILVFLPVIVFVIIAVLATLGVG